MLQYQQFLQPHFIRLISRIEPCFLITPLPPPQKMCHTFSKQEAHGRHRSLEQNSLAINNLKQKSLYQQLI